MSPVPPSESAPKGWSASALANLSLQDAHFNWARTSLRQALSRCSQQMRLPKRRGSGTIELQAALKADLDRLAHALDKLNHGVIRIAVFGLVSRGKSAVLNALIGQRVLQTGPLHGVTQWPRSVCWAPDGTSGQIQVELIDTPGLDEVGGQTRATMARDVAYQADLILFVVAGDITRTEYQALADLQEAQKPIILVVNKTDLYPQQDRQAIYSKLQSLFAQTGGYPQRRPMLSADEIVMVAAEPAPMEVRVEWPDGRVTHEWEAPPAQIEELQQKLLRLVQQEGKSLLAVNALRQGQEAEAAIAHKTLKLHQADAEDLIWQFARWKAIAIAANPVAVLDLIGGAVTDLVMIRSLARLYGLPMTRYEASKLWRSIIWSSGGLLLGEVGSGLLLGVGKTAAAITSAFDSAAGIAAYGSAAVGQATLAGYGTYRVGRAAQIYLERGCTWGPQGANTVMQDILNQAGHDTVLYRLRQELTAPNSQD